MIEIIYLAAFVLAMFSLGTILLKIFRADFLSYWEKAVFAQAVALFALIYITFALGMAGFLYSRLFTFMFLLLLLLNVKKIISLLSLSVKSLKRVPFRLSIDNFVALVIFGFLVFNFIASLAPPHSSDALSYHLAIPKIYAENHAIVEIPFILPSNYPHATEMIFLSGYLLKGGVLSEMIAFYMAALLVAAIYLFCRRHFSRRTALIAAALFYTAPIISVFSIRGFVDISTALFGFFAIYAFFLWHEKGRMSMLVFSALMAGTAMSTKLSAAPIFIALFGAVAYESFFLRKSLVFGIKSLAAYGISAFSVLVPWLAKAYAYTGNPVYPFAYKIFGGAYLSESLLHFWFQESLKFVGFGTGLKELILLPWNLTMHSPAFHEQLGFGPVFLAAIPLIFFTGKVDRRIKSLILIVAAVLLMWFFTAQQPRYTLISLAILSVIAAYVIAKMCDNIKTRNLAALLLLATLLINAGLLVGANNDEVRVAVGLTQKEEYLAAKVSNYGLLKYANENLPGNAKLCLYGESEGFYSERDYIWCHPTHQGYIDFYTISSEGQLVSRLKEIGITHLLMENSINDWKKLYAENNLTTAVKAMDNAAVLFDKVIKDYGVLVFENGKGRLYELVY